MNLQYEKEGLKFEKATTNYSNRFKRIAYDSNGKEVPKEQIAIYCGAITITKEREEKIYDSEGGAFSDPFFLTGAKLLVHKDKIDDFDQTQPPLDDKIIAVSGYTTTSSLAKNVYPSSEIREFKSRQDMLNSFNGDYFSIMVDHPIAVYLLEQLKAKDLLGKGYVIRPTKGLLSHEKYGILIYDVYAHRRLDKLFSEITGSKTKKKRGKNYPLFNDINNWINNQGIEVCKELQEEIKEKIEKHNKDNKDNIESSCFPLTKSENTPKDMGNLIDSKSSLKTSKSEQPFRG